MIDSLRLRGTRRAANPEQLEQWFEQEDLSARERGPVPIGMVGALERHQHDISIAVGLLVEARGVEKRIAELRDSARRVSQWEQAARDPSGWRALEETLLEADPGIHTSFDEDDEPPTYAREHLTRWEGGYGNARDRIREIEGATATGATYSYEDIRALCDQLDQELRAIQTACSRLVELCGEKSKESVAALGSVVNLIVRSDVEPAQHVSPVVAEKQAGGSPARAQPRRNRTEPTSRPERRQNASWGGGP
ncbi:MAG: hypothetical protein WB998_14435 [Solirubrobacteraceae bacterium]